MNILILGNQGYVGSVLTDHLKKSNIGIIDGYDSGFFAHCLTTKSRFPEFGLRKQIFKDVREICADDFVGYDAIIYLSAISNDPMGSEFSDPTFAINHYFAVKAARLARLSGVKSFIFASSCSVYGLSDEIKKEKSEVNPLTSYAHSKINAERDLEKIADDNFAVTCLRFATACGWSPRFRLDLVLNDFIANAIVKKEIDILSDGSPWRPLIHVNDMARAIEWALNRENKQSFLSLNVGSNEWNYRIIDLANAVSKQDPTVKIRTNKNYIPDNRSYRVDFSLFHLLAPNHRPQVNLEETIDGIKKGLTNYGFKDHQFRKSELWIRLMTIRNHIQNKVLDEDLFWIN